MEGMTKSSVGSWTRKRAFVGSPQKKKSRRPCWFLSSSKGAKAMRVASPGAGWGGDGERQGERACGNLCTILARSL